MADSPFSSTFLKSLHYIHAPCSLGLCMRN